MPDPTIVAAQDLFEDSVAGLRAAIEGLPAEILNRRPAGEDTNAIAVLAIHALYSTRSWLSLATGAELPARDRPAEFRVTAKDQADLLAEVDQVAAQCRALLASATTWDSARTGVATWRSGPEAKGGEESESPPLDLEPVTAAWAMIHAISHLKEHVAHAQLTRQVVERRT